MEAVECCEWIRNAKMGDQQAMENLLISHSGLLRALAKRFCDMHINQDELLQAGSLGLIRAVSRYDTEKGVKLTTYAVPWILGEMKKVVYQNAESNWFLSLDENREGVSLRDVLSDGAAADWEQITLRAALEKLPDEEQRIIILRYYRDQTQKQVACLLKTSQTTVSRIESRALNTLRMMLS